MSTLGAYTAYLRAHADVEAEISDSKGGRVQILTACHGAAVLTVTFRRTAGHIEPQPDTIAVNRGGKVTAYQRGQLPWAVADLTGKTHDPATAGTG